MISRIYIARAAICLLGAGLLSLTAVTPPLNQWTHGLAQAAGRGDDEEVSPAADDHRTLHPVRRKDDPLRLYWEGFKLKDEGNCEEAVHRLRPIALLGRGFEEAQHALGVCLMRLAGLPAAGGQEAPASPNDTPPPTLADDSRFKEGREWVLRAAEAGSFQAQRTLLSLYAAHLGPDDDPAEAAKWLYLYKSNPTRLSLGAQTENAEALDLLENGLAPASLQEGRTRAEQWTPTFWNPQSAAAAP